ncbi:HD domain-containing protein [Cerasicoccus frondis]|uniref:HD domain-containing protein n=1 Tax=Cerasicoccus frondis TaxID=490090 RepID=UPI0028526919|nr:hypothetical protein [Cerasicoccus frondis]
MANLPELEQRWRALCDAYELQGQPCSWGEVAAAYGQPHRAYHNLEHIEHCLRLLDEHRSLAESPDVVELAIWFHDFYYDTRAKDNEARSADLARECLGQSAGCLASQVASLILATQHTGEALSGDAALMVDIDLAILGSSVDAYNAYVAKIRQEYNWVEPDAYREGRSGVLRGFLKRSRIYQSGAFDGVERQARQNIERELATYMVQ